MTFDTFWRQLGDAIIECFTFVVVQDETLIEKKFRWDASPESTARVLDELIGFGILDQTKFDYGIVHPDAIRGDRLKSEVRKNIGRSMIDAFSPFDRAFRHKYPKVRYEEVFREHDRECNIITFGSPSSNAIARASLGYTADPNGRYELQPHFEPEKYPVRYDLTDETATIKRNRDQYREPKWSISTPERRLETKLARDDTLLEDYLVISCVPNLLSEKTTGILEAKATLKALRAEPDHESKRAGSSAKLKELNELEKMAGLGVEGMHRVLVLGGLHGPGTGAARLLLSDKGRAKILERRVREEKLDGKFWQAVIKVSEVRIDPKTGRDYPHVIDDRIDVYPVNIA